MNKNTSRGLLATLGSEFILHILSVSQPSKGRQFVTRYTSAAATALAQKKYILAKKRTLASLSAFTARHLKASAAKKCGSVPLQNRTFGANARVMSCPVQKCRLKRVIKLHNLDRTVMMSTSRNSA